MPSAGYSARDYAQRDPRARDILKLINDKKPKAAAARLSSVAERRIDLRRQAAALPGARSAAAPPCAAPAPAADAPPRG